MNSIVFLHGFLGEPDDWDVISASIQESVSVDAICLPIPQTSSWQRTVEDIIQRVPKNAVLIGYSMGARLALGCALADKSKLSGLVLVSGHPGLESRKDREPRRQHDLRVADELTSRPMEEFLNAWYRQPIFAGLDESQIAKLVKERRTVDIFYQQTLIRSNSISLQPNYWPELKNLTCPLLAISGEIDHKYTSIAARITQQVPNSEPFVVESAGHIVHFEQPKIVGARIIEFIQTQIEI